MELLIATESLGAGVLTFITEQCRCLPTDFNITLIYGSREETPESLKVELEKERKVQLIPFNFNQNPLNVLSQLRSHISENCFDIIHAHSALAGFYFRIISVAQYRNAAYFYNPHGYSFLRKDKSAPSRLAYFVAELVLAKVSRCTTISVSKSEHLLTTKRLKNKKSVQIDNGISIIARAKKRYRNRKLKIGSVGRLAKQKNPELFFNIARCYPELDFLWIGGSEAYIKPNLDNLEITGWIEHEKSLERLQELDVYVQTSLWEGLPLSVLEAMCFEIPVVATNITGNRDAIIHGVSGFLAENISDFQQHINNLINNESLRAEIGQRARYAIENHFNSKRMMLEYQDLYLSCSPGY